MKWYSLIPSRKMPGIRKYRRDTSEVSCCLKYVIFGVNVLFWVSFIWNAFFFSDHDLHLVFIWCFISNCLKTNVQKRCAICFYKIWNVKGPTKSIRIFTKIYLQNIVHGKFCCLIYSKLYRIYTDTTFSQILIWTLLTYLNVYRIWYVIHFQFLGLIILAVGVWAWTEKDTFNNLSQLTNIALDPAFILICVGE